MTRDGGLKSVGFRRLGLAALVVLAASAAGVAFAATRQGVRRATAASSACHESASVRKRLLAGPARSFAVLKKRPNVVIAHGGPDGDSACAVRALDNRYGTLYVWAEPSHGRSATWGKGFIVCTSWHSTHGGGGGGCGSAAQIDASGSLVTSELLVSLTPRRRLYTVSGIVPDGVKDVRVYNSRGQSRAVRVANNSVVVGVDGFPRRPARAYEYLLPDGHLETGNAG